MGYIINRERRCEIEQRMLSILGDIEHIDRSELVESIRNQMAPSRSDIYAVLSQMIKDGLVNKRPFSRDFAPSGYICSVEKELVPGEDEEIIDG